MAEMIDVSDPEWRTAVESVLGGSRFALIVDPKDSLKARQIAQPVAVKPVHRAARVHAVGQHAKLPAPERREHVAHTVIVAHERMFIVRRIFSGLRG